MPRINRLTRKREQLGENPLRPWPTEATREAVAKLATPEQLSAEIELVRDYERHHPHEFTTWRFVETFGGELRRRFSALFNASPSTRPSDEVLRHWERLLKHDPTFFTHVLNMWPTDTEGVVT